MTVAWNAADKSANFTLSGSNLIATTTSAAQGAVRADTSFAAGKLYWEAKFTVTAAGSNTGVGWANSTAALTSYIGSDKNGSAAFPTDNGSLGGIWFNASRLGAGSGPALVPNVVCIAIDIGGKLIWARAGAGPWNNSATADPGAGAGGYSLSTINAGPYFPIFGANSSGQSVTANFGASEFSYPIPAGFTGVDTNVQNYQTSTKFEGLAALGNPTTAMAATKFAGIPVIGTQQAGLAATKFECIPVIGPRQDGLASTKFLGYAIITPITAAEMSHGYIFG